MLKRPARVSRLPLRPVEETISHWVEFDGCPKQPEAAPPLHGSGTSAKHTAARIAYGPCHSATEVVLWKLTGAEHVWPGSDIDYLTWVLGPGTDVIDANTQMWRFFSRFRLDQ